MAEKINILVKNFNSYCVTLTAFVASITSNDNVKMYSSEVTKLERKQSNVIIDTFVLNGLKYEEQILEGNDSFFLGESFKEITNEDNNMIMQLFEFKNIWKQLNDQNRDQIKKYLKILCQIARIYLNLVIEMRDAQ